MSLRAAEFRDDDRVIFVSDVHLYYEGGPYLEQFVDFLRMVGEKRPAALFIHGDLFDFYVGPRQGKQAFYEPMFSQLAELVSSGIPVAVTHGNRDFLMGRRFREVGVEILPDEVTLRCGGQSVHLSHGDQFCIHDRSYQFWARGVLRAAPVRFVVKNLPVGFAVWLARRYRRVSMKKASRLQNDGKSRLPTVMDGVRQLLEADHHDVVICGHIHDLAQTPLEVDGRTSTLYTTGAWEDGPNYVAWADGAFSLERFTTRTVARQHPL